MPDGQPGPSVIVGIDGSRAAVHAAEWAIDDAIARGVSLRLVHVAAGRPASRGVPLDVEHAETVLRQADAAIQATGKTVEVETAIARGDPALAEGAHCPVAIIRHRSDDPIMGHPECSVLIVRH